MSNSLEIEYLGSNREAYKAQSIRRFRPGIYLGALLHCNYLGNRLGELAELELFTYVYQAMKL